MVQSKQSTFYKELSFDDDFNPSSKNRNTSVVSPTIEFSMKDAFDERDELTQLAQTRSTRPKESVTSSSSSVQSSASIQPSPLMCYTIRLKHGDELRKGLMAFAKSVGLKAAFVMTCVGSAMSAKVRVANAGPDKEANYVSCITWFLYSEGFVCGTC